MLIYAIDDELNMLYLLHEAIAEAAPEAEIVDFRSGTEALARMEHTSERPEAIFSDIRMPGLSGLELAVRLKQLSPETKIVFVTGYDYALDAYRLHVHGFISKPVEARRIWEELDYLFPETKSDPNRLTVRCFGSFEVFWRNQPLRFVRKQTKELLAFLVDRQGALCSSEEIIAHLWEDAVELKNARHRLRNLVADLRASLRSIGMEEALVSHGRQLAVRTDLLECDYYRMLSGDMAAVNAFRGQYMEQYSWAELTKGSLLFRSGKK